MNKLCVDVDQNFCFNARLDNDPLIKEHIEFDFGEDKTESGELVSQLNFTYFYSPQYLFNTLKQLFTC